MKKLVSLALALIMVLALGSTALAYSPEKPITIQFWHNRGSGANLDATVQAVDDFNATIGKEKGIVVEQQFIGSYNDLYTKTQMASQSGEQPVIASSGNTYIAPLIDDGILYDMMPLAQRDGFDVSNILDCFMEIAGNTDGTLYSLPYIRSTPLLYYNKTVADELGLKVPTTMDELVEFAKAFMQKDADGTVTRWGFEMFNDYGYYQASFLWQLGESMVAAGRHLSRAGRHLHAQAADRLAELGEGRLVPSLRQHQRQLHREGNALSGQDRLLPGFLGLHEE